MLVVLALPLRPAMSGVAAGGSMRWSREQLQARACHFLDHVHGADVTDLSLNQDGGVDGLERLDGLPGLARVLLEGQRGKVEDHRVKAGLHGVHRLGERVGMVRVEVFHSTGVNALPNGLACAITRLAVVGGPFIGAAFHAAWLSLSVR
jgi:hypothetical protein